MASWFVHSFPDRAVWLRALARDTVLCSWARHLTLTAPLSTQDVYEWAQANLMLGVTLWWTTIVAFHPGRSRNTPSCFMLQKPEISTGLMGHLPHMQTLVFFFLAAVSKWVYMCKTIHMKMHLAYRVIFMKDISWRFVWKQKHRETQKFVRVW